MLVCMDVAELFHTITAHFFNFIITEVWSRVDCYPSPTFYKFHFTPLLDLRYLPVRYSLYYRESSVSCQVLFFTVFS